MELSYVNTSGNTDTQTLAGKLQMKKKGIINRYFLNGNVLQAESEGSKTSNRISLKGRWERVFSERLFGLLTAGYFRNKFSGYDFRVFGGPGIGYDLIKTEKHKLQSLISLIFYHYKLKNSDGHLTGRAGKATAKYEWEIQENLKFKETLDYLNSIKDTDRYFIDSETSIEVKINSALSLGISYIVNYQNQLPSLELEHTDTIFLTTLIIEF